MKNHKRKDRRPNAATLASIRFGYDILIGKVLYRGRDAKYKRVMKTDKKTGVKEPTFVQIVSALPYVRVAR